MLSLGRVKDLPARIGQIGDGEFLLTGYAERRGESGQQRLQLTLEDATGKVTAFVWPEHRPSVLVPADGSPVVVRARVQTFDERIQLNLQCLGPLRPDQVESASALLPLSQCPEMALQGMKRLQELEASLPEPLDGFLKEVLLDPAIGIPMLKCRGSVAHHHAYPGGLLVHSTELLDLCATCVRTVIPQDVWSPHLAQLGHLFHDIGKLRSVGETARGEDGLVVPHDALTTEMLAPHLRWLEQRNPDLATGLRYVFHYLATPHRARRIPEYVVAEIVAKMDHWSAASFNPRGLEHLLKRKVVALPSTDLPVNAPAANEDQWEDFPDEEADHQPDAIPFSNAG